MGLALLVTLVLGQASVPDPLAPAWTGKIQCYSPNRIRKTCRSIATYRKAEGGTIVNQAEILIGPHPNTVWNIESSVRVEGDAVCGAIQQADIDASTYTTEMVAEDNDGRLSNPLIEKAEAAMKPMIGHDICTRFEPQVSDMLARVFVDGVAHPELNQSVIWITPDEKYAVQP
jgi:hypothetical protein